MAPEDSDFLCRGWVWDSALGELRYYERTRKGWKEEPEQVERLRPMRSLTWHRWSQVPMRTPYGRPASPSLSHIVIEFEGGGSLSINENDRQCAAKLTATLAGAFGVEVVEVGAPGRKFPTVPQPDQMGRWLSRFGRTEVVVDKTLREIVATTRRLGLSTGQRRIPFSEVRRLELGHVLKGPSEEYRLTAVYGPEERRLPLIEYRGYEGWSLPGEWEAFARQLADELGGVEVVREGEG